MSSRFFTAAVAVLVVALAGCTASPAPTSGGNPAMPAPSPSASPTSIPSPSPAETEQYDGPAETLTEEAQNFLFFEEREVSQLATALATPRTDALDAEIVEMAYQLCEYWGLDNTEADRSFYIINTDPSELDELFGKGEAYSDFFWRVMPSVSSWFCPPLAE